MLNSSETLELQREIRDDERQLWSGKPGTGLVFRSNDALTSVGGLFFGVVAGAMAFQVYKQSDPVGAVVVGILILVAIYAIVGRLFVEAYLRRRTVYGLTNKRAIIISGYFLRTVQSVILKNCTDIIATKKANGTGTIAFGKEKPFSVYIGFTQRRTLAKVIPTFVAIANVAMVEKAILDAAGAS